ncbi:MAG: hypothetical protein V4439_04005 [Patescibacteria group bacterium]
MKTSYKKIITVGGFSLFFVLIIFYAFFTSENLIFGVKIKNVNIVDGAKVENNILEVKGTAKNAVELSLNGRDISVDQGGNFNETIILLSGYNIIDIKAKDKFGNVDEKNYKLIY